VFLFFHSSTTFPILDFLTHYYSSEELNMAESTPKANSSSRRRKKWNHRNKYNLQEKQSSSNSRKSTVIANHTIEK
jgi:hypothetical protein